MKINLSCTPSEGIADWHFPYSFLIIYENVQTDPAMQCNLK
jgi:hypothetical protein